MANTRTEKSNKWEKERVQRVLDYHNNKYGTYIVIKGKPAEIYPNLKGNVRWDWVGYDTETNEEIAIEVKRITNTKLEEKSRLLWELMGEVQRYLNDSGELEGTYHISASIPREYRPPFNKKNIQILRDVLLTTICETAPKLRTGKEIDLIPHINKQLSFKFPDQASLLLHKLSDQGNEITKGSGITYVESIQFDETELGRFKKMVGHANVQLGKSKSKNNFLVLIEEGYRPIDPPEIVDAFNKIKPNSYSHMDNIYCVCGEKVTQIPLPLSNESIKIS